MQSGVCTVSGTLVQSVTVQLFPVPSGKRSPEQVTDAETPAPAGAPGVSGFQSLLAWPSVWQTSRHRPTAAPFPTVSVRGAGPAPLCHSEKFAPTEHVLVNSQDDPRLLTQTWPVLPVQAKLPGQGGPGQMLPPGLNHYECPRNRQMG